MTSHPHRQPTPRRAGTAAVASTVATVVPVFLLGGLSVQISGELHVSPAELGAAVAAYFAASALAAAPGGRLVERFGPYVTGWIAILLSSASMLAVAVFARDYVTLLILVMAGAPGNSLGQLASNLLLARYIPRRRQGLLFGLKQAAIPISTLLGGLSVPLIALTVGWRWAFALFGVLALGALFSMPRNGIERRPEHAPREHGRPSLGLVMIAVAATLSSGAANALSPFLPDTAVTRGFSPAAAGLVLTAGSIAGIVARIGFGWLTDRRGGDGIALIVVLLTTGSTGLALLAASSAPLWTLPLGAVLGFGLGWAWPGLMNLAITHTHPQAPAAATGVTQTGVYLGGVLGPLAFGAVAEAQGYSRAWLGAAAVMLAGAVFMLLGRRLLRAGATAQAVRDTM